MKNRFWKLVNRSSSVNFLTVNFIVSQTSVNYAKDIPILVNAINRRTMYGKYIVIKKQKKILIHLLNLILFW